MEKISKRLLKASPFAFNLYAAIAAFGTYFCMYAFRKPFSVALFQGQVEIPGLGFIDYKIALIIAQVIGYTISKFWGIKLISETAPGNRAFIIIFLIVIAEMSLFLFAIVERPWNIIFLFINGLPLGLVWGLVFGFLEGRKFSEILGAGLSASYILSSGFVKSSGKMVLAWNVSEFWMPFITGLFFFPILLIGVAMLHSLPPPANEDEKLRTKRKPMFAKERLSFFQRFAPGLITLTLLYMFLTAYRDFRDNFAREIWDEVGFTSSPEIFTLSELPTTIVVLILLGLLFIIKNNRRAFTVMLAVMFLGSLLIGLATFAFQIGVIGPVFWMILTGMGLYMGYVPFGCFLFDRLIAAAGIVSTAGFMIYVSDAFGYLGSIGLLLYKNFGRHDIAWIEFFIDLSYIVAFISAIGFIITLVYFLKVLRIQVGVLEK